MSLVIFNNIGLNSSILMIFSLFILTITIRINFPKVYFNLFGFQKVESLKSICGFVFFFLGCRGNGLAFLYNGFTILKTSFIQNTHIWF